MQSWVKLNPLLAYLIKRKYINVVDELMPFFGLWVADIPAILVLLGAYSDSVNVSFGIVVWGLIYLLLMFIPVPIAYACALATSHLSAGENYESVLLTSISSSTILWSYVAATLKRFRLILIVAIGFAPIVFLMSSIVWVGWLGRFGGSCVTAPIGTVYCVNVDVPPLLMGEKLAVAIQVSLTMVALAAFAAGTTIVMAFLGAILGFRVQNRFVAMIGAGVLAFAVSLLVGIAIEPGFALGMFIERTFDPMGLLTVLVVALVPYVIALGLVRRANSLIRNPTY